jgi:hypothetical protein
MPSYFRVKWKLFADEALDNGCHLLSWSVASISEICQKCDGSQALVGVSLNSLGE